MSAASGSPATVSSFSVWLLAIRPKTLPAAVAPVLVGCAIAWAEGEFEVGTAVAAFTVALLLQIGANLANDVADFYRGADTHDRVGPLRVTQGGLIEPRHVVMATVVALTAAAVPGLYLVWRGGWPLALLGLIAIVAAVTYTAGPKPLGYAGLGEIAVFVFFGPVAVAGTAFAMTHRVSPLALLASAAMGCLVTAILVVNNLRDIETDRVAGKRTLAVRIGRRATRWEYAALIAAAYAMPPVMWVMTSQPGPLLTVVTAPLAVVSVRQLWNASGRALNPVLAGTAQLCLGFAIALGAGIVL